VSLFPYPEQRVIEDAAYARGVVPSRIFALLLPVWSVTIQADITEEEDYALIDRFLARGIAVGGLSTTAELAGFYALEPELVDRALRALAAIGHVRFTVDRWSLTDIGATSIRAGKRYVVTREDRRKLYFSAVGSRPLTRPYYNSRNVTLVPAAELADLRSGSGPWFKALFHTRGLDSGALDALAANAQRERYNLPARIDRPRRIGEDELVYLPLYIVRGRTTRDEWRHLVYSQASDEADPDMSELVDGSPEIVAVLDEEVATARHDEELKRARDWLVKQNLDNHEPTRARSGDPLRVRLPASRFGGSGLPTNRIGSYVVQSNSFFQLWCDDVPARQRALLDRTHTFLSSRSRWDADVVTDWVARFAGQLELGTVSVAELRDLAAASKRNGLAAQLNRLI
jgi:hypothetical protein